jgi:hypothetical protein
LSNDENGLSELHRIIETDLRLKEYELYNKYGHKMTEEDFYYIRNNDVVYVVGAPNNFDFTALLADFEMI